MTAQPNIQAPSIPKATSVVADQESSSLLPGVNVLIEGPSGTGKTYQIGSLVDTGIETFYFGLEPGLEALLGYYADQKPSREPPPNLHWHTMILNQPGGFAKMADNAKLIGSSTYEMLCKIQDFTRAQNNQFERFLRIMNDFQDQRTGKSFGAVDTWGPDRAIVIDGLTSLGNFAMAMQVGMRPVKAKNDYMVAQDAVERFVRQCCDACKCHFVLIAHVEREVDEVLGGAKIMPSAPGQKLSPKLPAMFSDTILAVRRGTEWTWSTADVSADLKTRNLPYSEKIVPGFSQIISKWKSRGGKLSPNVRT